MALLCGLSHLGLPCWLEDPTSAGIHVRPTSFLLLLLASVLASVVGRRGSIDPLVLWKEVLVELRSCGDQITDCDSRVAFCFR